MPTINATPASATANSYITHAEANTYFEDRLPLATAWVTYDQEAVIIMAARVLDVTLQPHKVYVPASGGSAAHYIARKQWTGLPSTSTQRLAWPRTGMYNRNGVAIPSGEIPYELKEAQAELAGQLLMGDRTLDNDVIVQGVTSLSAGPVSLSFKDGIRAQVLPDAVLNLLPPSWLTDEAISYPTTAEFDVL